MERLFEYSNKLINKVDTGFLRYMHSEINWKGRMIGLIGPRGVGKTTLVLQYIKQNLNPSETLYSRRTRKMCKKFCKKNGVPKNPDYPKEYDCDNCPNMIIRYKYNNDFIAAFGNSYLYKKEGKME